MDGIPTLHRLLVCPAAMNLRSVPGPLVEPAHAEPLWIEVHQCRCRAAHRVISSDICCECGLAATTFRIQHYNLVQIASIRCNQHRSAGVSPSPLANNQHDLPAIRLRAHFAKYSQRILLSPNADNQHMNAQSVVPYHILTKPLCTTIAVCLLSSAVNTETESGFDVDFGEHSLIVTW